MDDKIFTSMPVPKAVMRLALPTMLGMFVVLLYNLAAKNYNRMTQSIRFAFLVSVGIGSFISIFLFFFASQIVSVFIQNDEVIRLGADFLRAITSGGPVLGIFFVLTFVFQAIGLALPSLILSISRQGLVFIPALFIGDALFGLNGVVWAQPIADFLSLCMAIVFFIRTMRAIKHDTRAPIHSGV